MKSTLPVTHLMYLHGFRSSPQSNKAQIMARCMAQNHPDVHWVCPALPPSPQEACELIDTLCRNWPADRSAVMGSSLGGFYATWLAHRHGFRQVLLNPAIFPERDLARYIGEHQAWHDPSQHFFFAPHFVQELQAMQEALPASPAHYLAILAKGDEVLDWREMFARYPGPQTVLLPEGDHALSDFPNHLPRILDFLGLEG